MTTTRAARSKGEEMGQMALDRAQKADPEWGDAVLALLKRYALNRGYKPWTCEDFLFWAHLRGLPSAPDNRAVGPLIAKATRDGIIKPVGFRPTVSSHGSPRRCYTRS